MRYSKLFGKTVKNAPKDEQAANAKLLIRGGFIDKLMSGSYTLLPLGKRVEQKIEQVVREEMNATGAEEMLMPLLHPKQIWNETGRWDKADEVMYKLEKNDREFALSFTHEEIFLDLIRKHAATYRDFPIKAYHFSTKFRSELRAKSGILRGREFLMKDLYSAHISEEDLNKYYDEMKTVYLNVFKKLGLKAIIAEAGGGVFTDQTTHEFQVLAENGEDEIIYCPSGDFAQNVEVAKNSEGDKCKICHKPLKKGKAIEVGNIFRFGTSYSEKMGITYTDNTGQKKLVYLGSYGIGITRMIGVIAEVSHDEKGIIWPESVAPFAAHLIEVHDPEIKDFGNKVYEELKNAGVEVLYDDRENISVGEKFADADLIGIPIRLVISKRNGDKIEVKKRKEEKTELVDLDDLLKLLH